MHQNPRFESVIFKNLSKYYLGSIGQPNNVVNRGSGGSMGSERWITLPPARDPKKKGKKKRKGKRKKGKGKRKRRESK